MRIKTFRRQSWMRVMVAMSLLLFVCGTVLFILKVEARSLVDNPKQTPDVFQDTASVNRGQLVLTGYKCRPCPLECDSMLFDAPGTCPVFDMNLYPKYEVRK